jgi:hypothetical protein
VKILILGDNQQITNNRFNLKRYKSYLVGISETTRENSELNNNNNNNNNINNNKFNQ